MIVCMSVLGPPVGLLDMGSLAMVMPKNGSGLAPTMGIDGAVWRSGSD